MRTKWAIAAALFAGATIGVLYFGLSRVGEVRADAASRAKGAASKARIDAASSADQAKPDTNAQASAAKSLSEEHGTVPASASSDVAVSEFKRAQRCHVTQAKITEMRNMIAACDATVVDSPAHTFCKARTAGFGEKVQTMSEQLTSCNADSSNIEQDYFRSVANAAKRGDHDAQLCYTEGDFKGGTSEQDVSVYQVEASHYANEAFERGDWRIATLLETTGSSLGHSGNWLRFLSIDVPVGTRATVYRMNRLLKLGAVGDYAAKLDRMAERGGLSANEVADADTWALNTYQKYFVNSPRLTEVPKACALQD